MTTLQAAIAPAMAKKQSISPQLRSAMAVREILFAVDFTQPSNAALQVVLHLAQKCHAKLTLRPVFEYAGTALPAIGNTVEGLNHPGEETRRHLDKLLKKIRTAGISVRGIAKDGLMPGTVFEAIGAQKPDLLVLATSGLHGAERFIFGSTAEAILRKVLCPVMTVGPAFMQASISKQARGPVIFATDFNLTTTDAVRHAAFYGQMLDAQLCCLHILPRSAKGTEGNHVIPEIMTGALQHVAAQALAPGYEPICDVGYGSDVSYAIVDYAKQHHAQLIVLGVRRASMRASHLPAHIAFRVIAEAPCPVVTVSFDVHGTAF